jgi:ATP-dependent helicase/nuclease subunit B
MPDYNSSRRKDKKLYLGSFHPFLEESLCSEVQRVRTRDQVNPILILVGSNLLGLYLRRMLAQKLGVIFNVRFFTFIDLARTIATDRLASEGRREVPPLADKLIIQEYLKKKKKRLKYFTDIVPYKGFRETLRNTIEDLKEAGISAPEFDEIIRKLEKDHRKTMPKFRELSSVFGHYSDVLEEKGFYDRSDLILEAIASLKQDEFLFPKAFDYSADFSPKFFIYGFYDFTHIQRRLLKECIQVSDCIAFFPNREAQSYKFAGESRQWFQDLEFQVIKEETTGKLVKSQLKKLQRGLFSDGETSAGISEKDRTFEIISAPGESREVREVLRKITNLISKGFQLSDMTVVIRNKEDYLHLFQEAFENNNISYYSPSFLTLSKTREGLSLLQYISLIGSDYSRSTVMDFLDFADLDFKKLFNEESVPAVADWDLISKEAGIVSGREEWINRLQSYAKRLKEYEMVDESGETVHVKREKIREAERFLLFMQRFFRDVESVPLEGRWSELSEKAWASFRTWIRDTDRMGMVEQALKELISLEQISERTHIGQFLEFLKEGFHRSTLRKGKFQGGGITLASLAASRGINFKIVIASGFVEKRFPAVVRQDPILLDADREKINDASRGEIDGNKKGKRLGLKLERIDEEKLLFDLLISSAQEKLILTFPRIDPDTAAEKVPSIFLLKASEALVGEKVDYDYLAKLPFFARTPLSQLFPSQEKDLSDEMEYDLKTIFNAVQAKEMGDAYFLYACSPFFQGALDAEFSRWGRRSFTVYDGVFNSTDALDLIRKKYSPFGHSLSATSLETYAACPFQYFCEKILSLEAIEEPEKIISLSPLDKGWLIHAILFEFFENLKKEKSQPLSKEHRDRYFDRMERIARNLFKKMEQRGRTGFPMMWKIEKDHIMDDLRELLRVEMEKTEPFIPSHFEVRFGMPESEELEGAFSSDFPVPLEMKDKKTISFKGRIDRIDLSEDQKRGIIIDYKTGKAYHNNNAFMGGQSLQLPIYIYAAEHLLKEHLKRKVHLDAARYFYVTRKGHFSTKYFDKVGWDKKLEVLKDIVQTITGGIERGLFFQREDEWNCRFCAYSLICGKAIDLRLQRKKRDPIIKDYLKMTEIP